MNLSAVFETWHLGDGNYPPLHKGMLVNLSFELEPDEMTACTDTSLSGFHHLGEANYDFAGRIIRKYKDFEDLDRLIVVECLGFRFYITGSACQPYRVGQVVCGRGTLLLDHYLWVEFLDQYPDRPDLFYKFRVERIWMNRIPDHYISRTANAMSYPTRLQHAEIPSVEVEVITRDPAVQYYVVEFSDDMVERNVPVPLTFLS